MGINTPFQEEQISSTQDETIKAILILISICFRNQAAYLTYFINYDGINRTGICFMGANGPLIIFLHHSIVDCSEVHLSIIVIIFKPALKLLRFPDTFESNWRINGLLGNGDKWAVKRLSWTNELKGMRFLQWNFPAKQISYCKCEGRFIQYNLKTSPRKCFL